MKANFRALVTSAHIFSPNEKEAISLVGPGTPNDIISRLVELGAEVGLVVRLLFMTFGYLCKDWRLLSVES